ncbi:MAG: SpoIIE family protein phosphatase [Thermoleophilaceae bacterium]
MIREPATSITADPRRRRTARGWAALAIGSELLFASLDYVIEEVVLVGGVVVGPLIASIRLGSRGTAWTAAVGLSLATAVAAVEPGTDDVEQRVVSVSIAVLGAALAIHLARVREERERTAAWLAAQHAVARVAAEAATLDVAAPRMLRAIGEALRWDVAVLWELDADAGVLRVATTWHAPGRDVTAFEELVAEREFPRGEGLPGQAWALRSPTWVTDVAEDATFTRAAVAIASGLRSGFAFPTLAEDEVLGVIEVYTSESRMPDVELFEVMATFGTQIGQFIESKRAQRAMQASSAALRRSRDELEATLGGLADGVTVQDATGRLVYANQAAADTIGFPTPAELVAAAPAEVMARFDVFDEHGGPLGVERLPGRQALAGQEPDPVVVRFRVRATGAESWSIVKATAVRDADGAVVRAVNIFEDISEQKRTEIGQRFLAEAGRAIGASLDYATTLRSVAQVAVPSFADWCAVDVLDDDGSLQRVAVAHVDPAKLDLAQDLSERYPPDPHASAGVPEVIRTGNAELHSRIPDELLVQAAQGAEHLELIRAVGLHSAMIVPLPAWRGALGAITFVNSETQRAFDEHDLELAAEVGRRAATAMENARLYGERAYIARTLQHSLLPPHLPDIAGLEVAARYRAAGEGNEVGGDFYDLFDTGDARWAVVIGDVCGKGADAAATTALARYTLRAAAMRERRPGRVLEQLNEALLRQRDDRQFCTVAYASVDVGAHGAELTVACGGHPAPVVVRRDGGVEITPCGGTLLGVVGDPELAEAAVGLSPGDAIVLYTDGVTEARTPDGLFGTDRLVTVAGGAAGRSATEIARRIEEAAASGELRDDLAIVVLRVPDSHNGRRPVPATAALPRSGELFDLRLPATAEAIRSARHAVDRLAAGLGPERLDDLRLLVSELVTNGLRHGSPDAGDWIGLRVHRERELLRVEVSDPGPGFDAALREAEPDATGGWGLYLVDRLAARWGVDRDGRTTVWFDIPLG